MATPEVRGVSGVAASKRRCGRSKEFRGEVDNPLTTKSEVFKQFFFPTDIRTTLKGSGEITFDRKLAPFMKIKATDDEGRLQS